MIRFLRKPITASTLRTPAVKSKSLILALKIPAAKGVLVRFWPRAPQNKAAVPRTCGFFFGPRCEKAPQAGLYCSAFHHPRWGGVSAGSGGWRGKRRLHGRLRWLAGMCAMHVIMTICLLTRSLCASTMAAAKCLAPAPGATPIEAQAPQIRCPAEDPANLAAPACATRAVLPCTLAEPLARPWCSMNRPPPAQTISCTCVPAQAPLTGIGSARNHHIRSGRSVCTFSYYREWILTFCNACAIICI